MLILRSESIYRQIKRSGIFKDGVLNIFTDASIKLIGPHTWKGCAGAVGVIVTDDRVDVIDDYILLDRCTNNIAELAGIEVGVDMAISWQYNFNRINLFNDSRISVYSLREWIFLWCRAARAYDNPDNMRNLKTSSGSIVSNVTHLFDIINKICLLDDIKMNIYHCRGHLMSRITEVMDSFKKENHIDISLDDAELLAHYNDMIDRNTRQILNEKFYDDSYKHIRREYPQYAITPMNMRRYAKIIGRREF